MVIACPACRSRYRIDPTGLNKKVARARCPRCGHGFTIDLAGPRKPKILIVDDARFFREVVLDILRELDVTILKAGDGDEALGLIRGERPDLVILDLKLPGKDGYQLVREIRADPALAATKLLAMSSVYRGEDEVRRIMQAGADDFLNKSFRPEQLLLRVRRLLKETAGHA